VYVIYNRPELFLNFTFYLADLLNNPNSTVGVVLYGPNTASATGAGLFASDLNGDGYDDLLIGSPNGTADGVTFPGTTYVVWGGKNLPGSIHLGSLATTQGITFIGANDGDNFGYVTATVGDINGDGFGDFSSSSPFYGGNQGVVYVFYGRKSGFPARVDVSSMLDSYGFQVVGNAGDFLGWDLSQAGDFNNDGLPDIIAGLV